MTAASLGGAVAALGLAALLAAQTKVPDIKCTFTPATLNVPYLGTAPFAVSCSCDSKITPTSSSSGILPFCPTTVGQTFNCAAAASQVVDATISVRADAANSNDCNSSPTAGSLLAHVVYFDWPGTPHGTTDAIVGDPVSAADGALFDTFQDLFLPGPLPFAFTRFYSSTLAAEERASSALGPNWVHSFDLRLELPGPTLARITFRQGQDLRFNLSGSNWTLSTADPFVYTLSQSGSTFRLTDPQSSLIYTFNSAANGRLEKIEDRNGNALTLTYANNLLAGVADSLGRSLSFGYSAGHLTSVQDQAGRKVSFAYSGGLLTSSVDAAGNIAGYAYTSAGTRTALLVSTTRPRGNTPYTQTYDANARVSSQKDAAGNTSSLAFNSSSAGTQTTATDPYSQNKKYVHQGRAVTGVTDENLKSTAISYDQNTRQLTHTDREGARTQMSYHAPTGYLGSITRADGARLSFTYAPSASIGLYDLTMVTFPDGSTESYQYDAHGNLIARTGRNGQTTRNTFNSRGQVLTTTLPTGAAVAYSYNSDATLASVNVPGRGVYAFTYDAVKRLSSRTNPDGSTWKIEYDANDRPTLVTDEDGAATHSAYDANSLLSRLIDPAGNATAFTYTGTDKIARVTDPLGQNTNYAYDKLDRTASVANALGATWKTDYDSAGRPVTFTDPEGKTWKAAYSPEDQPVAYTDPLNQRTTLTRDPLGRVTRIATPAGNETGFTYDSMNRPTAVNDPNGDATQFVYDAGGRLTALSLPGNTAASYSYDNLNRLISVTDPNGNQWSFSRDNLGALASSTDPLGNSTAYARDSQGRVSNITLPLGSLALTRAPSGLVTHAEYSDSTVFDYAYDARKLLTSATGLTLAYDARGDMVNSNGIAIERDAIGRIAKISFASDKFVTYSYDRRNLLTQVLDWMGGSTTFTYDDAGRLTSKTLPNNISTRYGYDADGKIVSIDTDNVLSIHLTRDKLGRSASASRAVPLTASADQHAQFQHTLAFDAASQVAGFTYDAMGRRTADATNAYNWDLASRLTSLADSDSGAQFQFQYDAFHLLASDGVHAYTWNYALALPSIATIDSRTYIHTPAGRLLYSIESDNTRRFFHYDEMGNTRALTDDSGAVTDAYDYSPYGGLAASSGSTDNPFTFAGESGVLRLTGTNLYLMRRRVYDALTGAFLSRDPRQSVDPRSINPYLYASANPLFYLDPSGYGDCGPNNCPGRPDPDNSAVPFDCCSPNARPGNCDRGASSSEQCGPCCHQIPNPAASCGAAPGGCCPCAQPSSPNGVEAPDPNLGLIFLGYRWYTAGLSRFLRCDCCCPGHGALMPDGSVVPIVGDNVPAGGILVVDQAYEDSHGDHYQYAGPAFQPSAVQATLPNLIPPAETRTIQIRIRSYGMCQETPPPPIFFTYDAAGRVISITDPNGNRTSSQYDPPPQPQNFIPKYPKLLGGSGGSIIF